MHESRTSASIEAATLRNIEQATERTMPRSVRRAERSTIAVAPLLDGYVLVRTLGYGLRSVTRMYPAKPDIVTVNLAECGGSARKH